MFYCLVIFVIIFCLMLRSCFLIILICILSGETIWCLDAVKGVLELLAYWSLFYIIRSLMRYRK
ncbi:E8 protein [Human papillomavirus type 1a]|uniref:E8 protein n=1 Tax=Human papillomavirus type 1 TaxID=10583 RepID=Q84215_HPV1|nr:E8 protein [Mupapillomavirus 1]CAA24315.1 E8 protein [Human papillomavirus type 1a]